jgi:hypothetical protein
MANWTGIRETLEEALIDLGFSAVSEFGVFVTYQRQGDLVKVHVAPDSMFAAFDADDEILGEGAGAEDLRRVVMEAAVTAARITPVRRSFMDRRRRTKGSSSRPSARAHSRGDHGEAAQITLSANAFSGWSRQAHERQMLSLAALLPPLPTIESTLIK